MTRSRITKLSAMAASLLAVALVGAWTLATLAAPPPPRPRPHRHPPAGVRRRLHKLPVKRAVVAKARPLVVGGTGPTVVVRDGTTVVREGPPKVVIKTVDNLPQVTRLETTKDSTAHKVTDVGDNYVVTLDVNGEKTAVRLLGVAPVQTGGNGGRPMPFSRIASRFLRNMLIGEYVYLEYDDNVADQDADGQTVAYVYRAPDGLFVNLEVVRQGFGLTATDYGFEEKATFQTYEQKAQADDKGIWGMLKQGPPAGRRNGPRPPINSD
ncbi:MAG TPA: thermonuclease family protein [Phycisphaerae bacterium]|nr:thermonuclease family protein [Phycisphaerae bacterium]